MKYLILLLALTTGATGTAQAQNGTAKAPVTSFKFDFGPGKALPGYTKVLPGIKYTPEKGYGFDLGTTVTAKDTKGKLPLSDGYVTAAKPFYFSVKVPEGNYQVKVTLGDDAGISDAAIRVENRRMMVNRLQTTKGKHQTVEFTVHVRDSLIAGTKGKVRLKKREHAYLHWDDKLTLEFNGAAPKVNAIQISPAGAGVVTLFLAGNSTVVDGASEPYSAWGQMIPSFFVPGKVAVANYAESGETLSSFISARRFEKMLGLMKPGDYAFVEFGHNDQKQKGEGVGAFTTYKKSLLFFISEVKKKGGIPVLVTPVQRRKFDAAGKIEETLGDYPDAVRQTAKEEGVALIDLNAQSKTLFEAMGPEPSLKAFVHFPANTYPNQPKAIADNTHFSPFGAYEVAKLIVTGIRTSKIGLAKFIKTAEPAYDPVKPGDFAAFYWPDSPSAEAVKPDGN